jgi:hypothetical protein
VPTSKARANTKSRVDIDDDMDETNKVRGLLRRIPKTPVQSKRTSKKMKQLIVRRANKLQAEDLECMAVLKRCGLYISAEEMAPTTSDPAGMPASSVVASSSEVQEQMNAIWTKTAGRCGLLKWMVFSDTNQEAITQFPACMVDGAQGHRPLKPPRATRLAGSRADMSSQMEEEQSEAATEEEDEAPSEVVADE